MTDSITVRGLRVATRIGVTPEERASPQVIVVDLEIRADLAASAASDDLADTIDYDALVRAVADVIRGSEVSLLETLAERIAGVASASKSVNGVTVVVAKEKVPVREDVREVAVRIERDVR